MHARRARATPRMRPTSSSAPDPSKEPDERSRQKIQTKDPDKRTRKDTTMPDILHRISIDAPQERVHDLVATTEGVARWWTGRRLSGETSEGSRFSFYFGDATNPAATPERTSDNP